MPKVIAWFLTFNFVNLAWVFFRANTFSDALKVIRGMLGLNGIILPSSWADKLAMFSTNSFAAYQLTDIRNAFIFVILGLVITLACKNSIELKDKFKPNILYLLWAAILALIAFTQLTGVSEFLYFNF